MAKVIMIQGTMSNVGKSLITAGLCRVFKQDGYKVAPFKSQNMALNSYITDEGLEIGRAQAMQAEASGIAPSVYMNPILLKPTSDVGSQVIVNGRPIGNMRAGEYFKYKTQLMPEIKKAFKELEKIADIIVIEGAGSPSEINLKDNDIVNMGMAKMVDAPVLLVGDIDRGGVFAQLLGTIMLLDDDEKERVKGLVVNKFRGDVSILEPGLKMLEDLSLKPIAGVLPYTHLSIDDEDSLSEKIDNKNKGTINISVIKLPHMSNFSDFLVFDEIDAISVRYINRVSELEDSDMIIIPGTKNTIGDLKWLRSSGFEAAIKKFSKEKIVFGICGGFQMLGRHIEDPEGIEEGGSISGLEMLEIDTVLGASKVTTKKSAVLNSVNGPLSELSQKEAVGYEIHMGITKKHNGEEITILENNGGNVYGSYLHGFFDNGDIAAVVAKSLAKKKEITLDENGFVKFDEFKENEYDKLADMIRNNMDMEMIYHIMGMEENDCNE